MKKNIYYLLAHQDDEFGIFIDIHDKIKNNNVYIFYLTNGYNKKINKSYLSARDKESIKVLKKIGVSENRIIFLGKQLDIFCNKLHLSVEKVYEKLIRFSKINIPNKIVSHAWEGGHEDHDACNLIARKLAFKFNVIKKSQEFSLYNAFNTNLIYFKVFNPIGQKIIKVRSNFLKRFFFVRLLFFYKSQLKIWLGLYPFIIFHYVFFGYNLLCPLNTSKIIKRPHSGKLLYELRNFCNFKLFRNKTKFFLNDTR